MGEIVEALATRTMLAQSPEVIVELVGPAAAGKTTLSRALTQRAANIRIGPDIELRKIKHLRVLLANIPFLAPIYLQRGGSTRGLTWAELKYLTYLKGWPRLLRQEACGPGSVVLLDHGPIFRLATLREFGPERLRGEAMRGWWDKLYRQWALTLDMIIWLDASDAVLIERINARDRGHEVKGKSDSEARQFLARYRRSYAQTLGALKTHKEPALLQFDTNRTPIDEIVEDVLAACQVIRFP